MIAWLFLRFPVVATLMRARQRLGGSLSSGHKKAPLDSSSGARGLDQPARFSAAPITPCNCSTAPISTSSASALRLDASTADASASL